MIDNLLRSLFRYALPKPLVDRLLRAALLEDQSAAAAAWREYEASADFDHLTPAEMRFLGLVSKRLGTLAPDSPMRTRIGGIERANWSRSQLAIGEAGTGLCALEAERVNMLTIKGAGRVAAGGTWARGHLVNHIDIVVQLDDMERTFDLLTGDGWRPAGPGTAIYQRARLSDVPSLNFVRGQFGSIGVHRAAFYPPHASMADDPQIWRRSVCGKLAQATVRMPSATDAVTMALADGMRNAHNSGDQLAAVAVSIDAGVDWELLQFIADRRRLHAPAAAGLRYVRERLERSVPDSVLRRLERGAIRHPLALIAAFPRARRNAGAIHLFRLALAAVRQGRLFNSPPADRLPIAIPVQCSGRLRGHRSRTGPPLAGARDGRGMERDHRSRHFGRASAGAPAPRLRG